MIIHNWLLSPHFWCLWSGCRRCLQGEFYVNKLEAGKRGACVRVFWECTRSSVHKLTKSWKRLLNSWNILIINLSVHYIDEDKKGTVTKPVFWVQGSKTFLFITVCNNTEDLPHINNGCVFSDVNCSVQSFK